MDFFLRKYITYNNLIIFSTYCNICFLYTYICLVYIIYCLFYVYFFINKA